MKQIEHHFILVCVYLLWIVFFCYAIYKIVSKNELDLINANERWIYLMIMLKATLPIELESNHILWNTKILRKMRQLEATKNEQWFFDAFIFFQLTHLYYFFSMIGDENLKLGITKFNKKEKHISKLKKLSFIFLVSN